MVTNQEQQFEGCTVYIKMGMIFTLTGLRRRRYLSYNRLMHSRILTLWQDSHNFVSIWISDQNLLLSHNLPWLHLSSRLSVSDDQSLFLSWAGSDETSVWRNDRLDREVTGLDVLAGTHWTLDVFYIVPKSL